MKGSTNIQVNGNVYGGIHVHGGCSPSASTWPDDIALPRGQNIAGSIAWSCGKGIALLAGGAVLLAGAVVAAGVIASLALGLLLGVLTTVCVFYLLCRIGDLLRLIEHGLGGSPTRLIGAAPVWRAISPGHKVRELDALAIREAEYVDSN